MSRIERFDPWEVLTSPTEPRWHGRARTLFKVAFVLVWVEAVACFLCFRSLIKGSSPVATPELTARLVDHSHVYFVATSQKHFFDLLLTVMNNGYRVHPALSDWRQNLRQSLARPLTFTSEDKHTLTLNSPHPTREGLCLSIESHSRCARAQR
jgi:hypothetical protein